MPLPGRAYTNAWTEYVLVVWYLLANSVHICFFSVNGGNSLGAMKLIFLSRHSGRIAVYNAKRVHSGMLGYHISGWLAQIVSLV